MTEVIARLGISLDGYIAGPESGPEHPLGIGGERLHSWVFGLRSFRRMQGAEGGAGGPDDELLAGWIDRLGPVVMGHGMFVTGRSRGATSRRSTRRCSSSPTRHASRW